MNMEENVIDITLTKTKFDEVDFSNSCHRLLLQLFLNGCIDFSQTCVTSPHMV